MKTGKWMTIGMAAVIATALPQWTPARERGKSGRDGNAGKATVTQNRARSGEDGNVGRTAMAKERAKSGKDGNTGQPDDGRNRSRSGTDGNTGGSTNVTSSPGCSVQHAHGETERDNGHGAGKGENAHGGDGGDNGHGKAKGQNEPQGGTAIVEPKETSHGESNRRLRPAYGAMRRGRGAKCHKST